jgi:hypothetical protein
MSKMVFAILLFLITFSVNTYSQSSPISTEGKKFWVSFPKVDSTGPFMNDSIGEISCHLSIHTTGYPTSGRIITPDTIVNFTLNASNQFTFETNSLNPFLRKYYIENSEVIESKGVYIETVENVSVFLYVFRQNLQFGGFSNKQIITGSTIIYPLESLSKNYITISRNQNNRPTQFLIVATEDSTEVEITPTKTTEGGKIANVPFVVFLNKGQTYLVRSSTEDLTGSRITSLGDDCKRIAVFSGTSVTTINKDLNPFGLSNTLLQQLPPLELIGKKYISHLIDTRGAFYKILAIKPESNVVINGLKIRSNMESGQFVEVFSDTLIYIYSNNPILVAQFNIGANSQFPTMFILPSIEQKSKKVVLPKYEGINFPMQSNTNKYYVFILSDYNNRLFTRINGQPTNVDNWFFSPFFPTLGIYAELPLYQNTLTIENSVSSVQAFVYNWTHTRQGFALTGGVSFGNTIYSNIDTTGIYENNTYCQGGVSSFEANADSTASEFYWEFGDGGKKNGKKVDYIYKNAGQYSIKLITYRDAFCSYDTVRKTITVNPSPVIKAGSRPKLTVCNGQTVVLGQSEVPGLIYRWSPSIGLSDSTKGQTTAIVSQDSIRYYLRGYDQYGCVGIDSIIVRMHKQPIANAGPDTVSCGGNGVQIGQTTTGGTPLYSFLWTPAAGLSNPNIERPIAAPTITTTYILRVTDINSCVDYDTVVVQALQSPTIDAGLATTICEGDSVQLNATATDNPLFRWVNARNISDTTIGNPTVFPSVTTTYYVAGIFETGCVAFDSVLVTVTPKPRLPIAFQTTACPNATKTYTVENRGDITYNWEIIGGAISSGQGTNEATVTWGAGPTGSIKLTTSTAGLCSFDTTVNITISSDIKPTITENKNNRIVPSRDTVRICPNESVTLDVGVGYTEITWTNGSTNRQTTVSSEGWVGVQVKDATGCSGGDSVYVQTVPPPIVFAGNDRVLCGADTAVMSANVNGSGTYTYQWIPPTAVSDPTALITDFIAPTTTNLIFQAIDTVNGCTTSDTVLMTKLTLAGDFITTSKQNNVLCFGEQMTLDAGAFDSYTWSTGETTRTINITNGGSYWVDAKSGSCSAIDSIQIIQNPQIVVIPTPDITASPGATVTLDANATGGTLPYQFQWTPTVNFVDPSTIQSPRVTANVGSQSYIVTITDANDCVARDTITVFVPSTSTTVTVARREVSASALNVSFPLTLTLDPTTPITPTGFTATLTVPFEQFIPKSVTKGDLIITQNATDYVVNITVPITEPLYHNSVITELVGDILLGQQDTTPILISNPQWQGTTYPVNVVNGAIVLNDVCYSGTRRYLLPTTIGFGIMSINPNPAQHSATFEFGIIESGKTTFEIIDVFGNVVHSTEFYRESATPKGGSTENRYTHVVDVSSFPSGTYYGVLKSFSQRATVPLVITK